MRQAAALSILLAMLTGLLLPARAESDSAPRLPENMTLREKLLQMLMVDFRYWDEDPTDEKAKEPFVEMNEQVRQILRDYPFGGVLYFAQNLEGTEQAFLLTREIRRAAAEGGHIPPLICTDQEGGSVYRLSSGTALPGNMALAATGNADYARLSGRIIGSELQALGINTNLAPVVDINSNPANPVIGLRSFGDDVHRVGQMAAAMLEGMEQFGIIGCAKHFPGHGDTAVDSHYGLPVVDRSPEALRSQELVPFQMAIDRGIDMIMTAHILFPQLESERVYSRKTGNREALPATMSHTIVTELLKQSMGFEGIVVTDAMNMAGITAFWDPTQAAVLAIQAGVDMVCMPCDLSSVDSLKTLDTILAGITAAVEDGTIPLSRIDDAVGRILRVKANRGILSRSREDRSPEDALAIVGGAANREAERHIAAAAVTVVENKNDTLPLILSPDSRVLMLTPYENELAQLLLGWNRALEAGLIPAGAQVQAQRFDSTSTADTFHSLIEWADVVILQSEVSQADRLMGGHWTSAFPMQVTDRARALGKTVIVQSVDKPYDVQCYEKADAVLAVYGCKGSGLDPTEVLTGGVTDSQAAFGPNIVAGIEVIFGVFGAQGTLPVEIPRYENGRFTEAVCYPRGWGLTYSSRIPEAPIPAFSGISSTEAPPADVPTEISVSQPQSVPSPETPSPLPGWLFPALLLSLVALSLLLIRLPGGKRRKRRKKPVHTPMHRKS